MYPLIYFVFILPPIYPQAYIFKCLSDEYTGTEVFNLVQRKHVNVLHGNLRDSLMPVCTCVLVFNYGLIQWKFSHGKWFCIKSIVAVPREQEVH